LTILILTLVTHYDVIRPNHWLLLHITCIKWTPGWNRLGSSTVGIAW